MERDMSKIVAVLDNAINDLHKIRQKLENNKECWVDKYGNLIPKPNTN